jgi:hypothetical protein
MKMILALLLSFSMQSAFAYDSDENYENYEDYDSIVGDLSSSHSSARDNGDLLNLDNMKLQAGFGFNNTLIHLKSAPGAPDSVSLDGFQLSLGIDLFSPNVITEVGLVNYNAETVNSNRYAMKEFDLKTYYTHRMNRYLALRGGAGLGIRYIDINADEYTNPVSQILGGAEVFLGKKLSFVTELSYKSSLVSDAPENSAFDLTFRVDGHF